METEYKYMVCTRCLTYNHSNYIEDTLRGFAMQEITFPAVYCIIDDASTDGEQDILRRWADENLALDDESFAYRKQLEYGEQIHARLKGHDNALFVILLLYKNHYRAKIPKVPYISEWNDNSKYNALCEGDDYWIVKDKLQKQVEILEQHHGCYLCGTNGIVKWNNSSSKQSLFNTIKQSRFVGPSDIIGKWLFPTASLLFRNEVRKKKISSGINTYSGDQTFILIALSLGDIYALSDVTCVYRRDTSNRDSATNMAKRKGREYITEQHIQLYSLFNDYTEGRFSSYINPLLERLNKRLPVYKKMNHSYILAFLEDPIVFLSIAFKKLKN